MNIVETQLKGVRIIEPKDFQDERGGFVKIFHQASWLEANLPFQLAESYYSTSRKQVIRGMHFQTPPADHTKLVYVTNGAILDVVLDIRAGSPSYGQYISLEVSAENHKMIYIPAGFAHGFMALTDNACVTYLQTTMHSPEHDQGIRFDSFGFDWGISQPIISKRDQQFPSLAEFKTPFTYQPL